MEAIDIFKSTNMDKKTPIKVKGVEVAPRDVIAAAAPDPNEIGKKYVGQTAAGTWVRGKKDGMVREVYLYQIADNAECVAKYGTQVVTAQTALHAGHHARAARHRQARGYKGNPEAGVHVPEEFSADDYVALMPAYEFPGGLLEMDSEYKRHQDHASLDLLGQARRGRQVARDIHPGGGSHEGGAPQGAPPRLCYPQGACPAFCNLAARRPAPLPSITWLVLRPFVGPAAR